MPRYNNSPFRSALAMLYAGVASYFFGSWAQDRSPTRLYVTSVGLAGNVGTLGVTVYEGDVPAVGSLLSVQGTQTAGGACNVTNATITAVNLNAAGVGTVSFALAGANAASVADAGVAIVPQPELAEAIANGASVPVAMSNNSFGGDLDKTLTVVCAFPALPGAVTVTLQGALFDQDAQYVSLGTVATVAGGNVTANGLVYVGTYLFYRVLVTGLNGAGTMTCKIEA